MELSLAQGSHEDPPQRRITLFMEFIAMNDQFDSLAGNLNVTGVVNQP